MIFCDNISFRSHLYDAGKRHKSHKGRYFFEVIDYYLFRLRSNGSVISNRRRLE